MPVDLQVKIGQSLVDHEVMCPEVSDLLLMCVCPVFSAILSMTWSEAPNLYLHDILTAGVLMLTCF